jgi:hypothetical protein
MNAKNKELKLAQLAEETLAIARYQGEFDYLFSELKISRDEVIRAFITWDLDPDAYGNEFYDSVAARFAMHLKNRAEGSWHKKRQVVTVKILQRYSFTKIVDVGFGVPQQYLKDIVLKQRIICQLLDAYPSAITFGQALLNYWDNEWSKTVNVKQYDMNSGKSLEPFDVYLFQDSIEHSDNPTEYLKTAVAQAPQNSRFIFSLPIAVGEAHEPSHMINWSDKTEAEQWLRASGLRILNTYPIQLNREIDIFAQSLNNNYFQLIAECSKAS